MATNSPSRNGQSYRLTKSGWASQNVLPFWREEEQNVKSKLPETEPTYPGDCLYAGGLHIRVPDTPESRPPGLSGEKIVQVVSHDHSYFKKSTIKRRKSRVVDGVDNLLMKALADIPNENIPKRGEVSEQVKNTQLYKYLMTPVDHRRKTGEAFGHNMVREIIASASHPSRKQEIPSVPCMLPAKVGFGMGSDTTRKMEMVPGGNPKNLHGIAPVTTACTGMTPAISPKTQMAYATTPPIMMPAAVKAARPKIPRAPSRQSKRPLPPTFYSMPEPKLPAPDFVDLPQEYWTADQCLQYDLWWQQLPSCQYSACQYN